MNSTDAFKTPERKTRTQTVPPAPKKPVAQPMFDHVFELHSQTENVIDKMDSLAKQLADLEAEHKAKERELGEIKAKIRYVYKEMEKAKPKEGTAERVQYDFDEEIAYTKKAHADDLVHLEKSYHKSYVDEVRAVYAKSLGSDIACKVEKYTKLMSEVGGVLDTSRV